MAVYLRVGQVTPHPRVRQVYTPLFDCPEGRIDYGVLDYLPEGVPNSCPDRGLVTAKNFGITEIVEQVIKSKIPQKTYEITGVSVHFHPYNRRDAVLDVEVIEL